MAAITMIVVFAMISSGYLLSDRMTYNPSWCVKNEESLDDSYYMGGEYLPENGECADKSITDPVFSEGVRMTQCDRNGSHFRISCSNESERAGYIDAPLLYYRGYEAVDTATGIKLEVVKSEEAKVRIMLPAGFGGEISLHYHEYWYWRVCEMISLLTLIGVIWAKADKARVKFL